MNSLMSCRANSVRLRSAIDTLQVESRLLKGRSGLLQEGIGQARRAEREASDRVVASRKDKQDLVERLAAIERKTIGLSKQVCSIMSPR